MTPSSSSLPRLLVIDDEESVLKLVKSMLTRAQYDVTTCVSAEEAIRLLTDSSFDCVITDAIMPAMNGYEFVRTVRGDPVLNALPVLMLTRKRHRQDVKKAVEAGVTDYVLKPIDEQLLLEKVEMCLKMSGKSYPPEHTLTQSQSEAKLQLSCKVISISDSEINLRLPVAIEAQTPFQIHSRLFEEIGIGMPMLKLERCAPSDGGFEAKLTFVAAAETDLAKIRSWLAIQSRKKN